MKITKTLENEKKLKNGKEGVKKCSRLGKKIGTYARLHSRQVCKEEKERGINEVVAEGKKKSCVRMPL